MLDSLLHLAGSLEDAWRPLFISTQDRNALSRGNYSCARAHYIWARDYEPVLWYTANSIASHALTADCRCVWEYVRTCMYVRYTCGTTPLNLIACVCFCRASSVVQTVWQNIMTFAWTSAANVLKMFDV